MSRWNQDSDWDDDDDDQDEADVSREYCAECGREIDPEADQCYHCGYFILDDPRAATRKPSWIVITAVVLLLLIVVPIVWSFFHR